MKYENSKHEDLKDYVENPTELSNAYNLKSSGEKCSGCRSCGGGCYGCKVSPDSLEEIA